MNDFNDLGGASGRQSLKDVQKSLNRGKLPPVVSLGEVTMLGQKAAIGGERRRCRAVETKHGAVNFTSANQWAMTVAAVRASRARTRTAI